MPFATPGERVFGDLLIQRPAPSEEASERAPLAFPGDERYTDALQGVPRGLPLRWTDPFRYPCGLRRSFRLFVFALSVPLAAKGGCIS